MTRQEQWYCWIPQANAVHFRVMQRQEPVPEPPLPLESYHQSRMLEDYQLDPIWLRLLRSKIEQWE